MSARIQTGSGHVIIILNSIPPYAYEVNNILSLPNGSNYRFRFRKKWMPTIKNPLDMIGQPGLIILRNFATAEFMPLRRIRISDILEIGEVSYIEYTLQDIIDFDSDRERRHQQLYEFNERIKVAIRGFDNNPNENLRKLIFQDTDPAFSISDDNYEGTAENRVVNSWGNLLQIISEIDCFQDFDFLKVIAIVDNKGNSVPIKTYPYSDTARYRLRNNLLYRLRVFQTTFTGLSGGSSAKSGRRLVLQGEPGQVLMVKSTHIIAGKYDLMEFKFKTETTSRAGDSSLTLEIHRDDEQVRPNIDIPIRVTMHWTQVLIWIVSIVAFMIGVFLLFRADLIKGLTNAQIDVLERLGIIVTIISSYGVGSLARSMLEKLGVEFQV